MALHLARDPLGTAPGRRVAVVHLVGEQDLEAAPALRNRLVELLRSGERDVLLDLGGVTFFDTSALGAIVDAHRAGCAAGATLLLCGVSSSVRRVLEITGLDRVLLVR